MKMKRGGGTENKEALIFFEAAHKIHIRCNAETL
jgi:hypothetical protein